MEGPYIILLALLPSSFYQLFWFCLYQKHFINSTMVINPCIEIWAYSLKILNHQPCLVRDLYGLQLMHILLFLWMVYFLEMDFFYFIYYMCYPFWSLYTFDIPKSTKYISDGSMPTRTFSGFISLWTIDLMVMY